MANVLDKFIQKTESDLKNQEQSSLMNKKAYNNMMAYLKEMKLDNTKNLERAEQIYLLSENSVEKLNEMHDVLEEKLGSAADFQDTEELLKRTELLQRQIGNMTVMLRNVYEKQNAELHSRQDTSTETAPAGISYEEFREMQEIWKQFEEQMESKFNNQEMRVKSAVQLEVSNQTEKVKRAVDEGLSGQKEVIASAIKNQMYGFRTDLAEVVGEEITEYNTNVKNMTEQSQQVFEDSLENHERVIKKEISLVQEMLENSMEEYHEKTLEEITNIKKVSKGYARMAMLASFLSLIILFLDILVLK